MIDPHMSAFNTVSAALHAAFSTIYAYPEWSDAISNFPAVIMQEINNTETARSLSNNENAARIGFQFDIYSNAATGNLAQRQGILATIDASMRALGYSRDNANTDMPNIDNTIKRTMAIYSQTVPA